MTWFFLALLGPVLHALSSHIDRCLMHGFFTANPVAMVLLITMVFSGLPLPVILWLNPGVLAVAPADLWPILIVALLNTGVLWAYLTALSDEDTTTVVILYQLMPIFGLVFGVTLLGEDVGTRQVLATAAILLGAMLVLIDRAPGRQLRLRRRTLILMTLASAGMALGAALFKRAAVQTEAWPTIFWQHLCFLIFGLTMLATMPHIRAQFLSLWRRGSRRALGVNVLNEVVFISGNMALSLAFMLAPVSMVLLANAFEPLFVLLIALILPLVWPAAPRERLGRVALLQKSGAIALTGLGSYILTSVQGIQAGTG